MSTAQVPSIVGFSRRSACLRRRNRRGMGLVEMLIALIIAAALLTATAVAVDSSFRGYAINQQQANLMHQARVTIHRISTSIRLANEHAPEDSTLNAQFKNGQTITGTGIAMFDEAGEDLTFSYDAPNKRVLAIYNGTQRTICSGVEAFTVRMEPKQSETNKKINSVYDLLDTATILLTVRTRAQD